ncbi:hypothetical protein [Bosea minatitlanensis]|uniref:Uncharacterized protein n=1 Tax=Bosea minatitlanensis TaxID=128782 RepID=A0ABW0F876_9HYPH|nr:hypothetical protein [Bosea minatitlanensis]MCT4494460.1 hypothetical protein [Bosea minatitlanensis]
MKTFLRHGRGPERRREMEIHLAEKPALRDVVGTRLPPSGQEPRPGGESRQADQATEK